MHASNRTPRHGGALTTAARAVPPLPAPPWAADLVRGVTPEDLRVDFDAAAGESLAGAGSPLSYRDDVSGVEAALLRAELLRELREVQRGAG